MTIKELVLLEWEEYISHIKNIKQEHENIIEIGKITEEEKEEIINNLEYLKINFDLDNLDEKHPLWFWLFNQASYNIRQASEFGWGIKNLKRIKNFNEILERLRSLESFGGVYPEFQTAISFKKNKIPFEFIKTELTEKTPDIEIRLK